MKSPFSNVLPKIILLFMAFTGDMVGECQKLTENAQTAEAGFIPIFDGKTLTNWEGDPNYWRVENGNLVGIHRRPVGVIHSASPFKPPCEIPVSCR